MTMSMSSIRMVNNCGPKAYPCGTSLTTNYAQKSNY